MASATSVALVVESPASKSALDPVLFHGLFALLLFDPLAFGAVEPWSTFLMETGSAALFVLWAIRQVKSGELRIAGSPLFPPMIAFGVLIGLQLAAGLSAYPYATASTARLYCSYGLLCFLVVQCLRRTAQVKTLARMFSIYGCAVAVFAVVQGMSANGKLYWVRVPRFGGWIYGPYVNHNHYAGLMEMLAPIPLVLALSHHVRGPHKKMALAAAAVMASSIFLSGSRGGMAAFAVQMAVLAILILRKDRRSRAVLAMGIFLIALLGLLAWLGGGELTKRMASIHQEARGELSGGTRLAIDRDGLRMFASKPILGWGLGAFPEVYPQFRSFYTNFFVNEAHNDYVQLLVEVGALGFAVMLWFVAVLYRRAAKKLGNWTTDTNSAVALAALLGCTGILVHSFVDFNLQVPANAALFYVLCVVAAMEPRFGLSRRRNPTPDPFALQASA